MNAPAARRRAASSRLAARQAASERGFALFIVLWFLVLLAAIGTYLMANARLETALAHNILAAARAEALADAGIAQAVFNLEDPTPEKRWLLDGTAHVVRLPGGQVSIRLQDESQKINPNRASAELLSALLEAVGIDHLRALRLGAAMADWVSPDGPSRPLGAKKNQYLDAGLDYGPPNAPIESLDELQLVLGMTPDIFAIVRPYLSIYADAPAPDAKNAPPAIRRALAMAAPEQTEDDPPPASSAPASAAAAGAKAPKDQTANDLPVLVAIDVTAQSEDGGVFVRHAVLRLDPGSGKGYAVLDWSRGNLAK